MATRQQIENDVRLDVKAVLDAASITNVVVETTDRPAVAVYVRVMCVNLRGNLMGGTLPTGMYQADMSVEVFSHYDDDSDAADMNAKIGEVTQALWTDDILTTLNSASTYHTYYGMGEGDSIPDQDGRYRIRAIQFSLILKPEKA